MASFFFQYLNRILKKCLFLVMKQKIKTKTTFLYENKKKNTYSFNIEN